MLSIRGDAIPPPQMIPPTKFTMSIWLLDRGVTDDGIAIGYRVLDQQGKMFLPMPKWFRRNRWTQRIGKGKDAKSFPRDVRNYIEAVVADHVSKQMEADKVANFVIDTCGRGQ